MFFFRTATERPSAAAESADETIPNAYTTRNWAKRYFEPWLESKTSGRNTKVDLRSVWTEEIIYEFFEFKDQEYLRFQPVAGILRGFC